MFRCSLWAIAAAVRPKVLLIAVNLCLQQQLLVLQRRKPRPRLKDADRRFWVLACRWFVAWRTSVLMVNRKPCCAGTVTGGALIGADVPVAKGRWAAEIAPELRTLIRRMTIENRLGVSAALRAADTCV
jgi:hypothetical protein